jgi:hypothetical protein
VLNGTPSLFSLAGGIRTFAGLQTKCLKLGAISFTTFTR